MKRVVWTLSVLAVGAFCAGQATAAIESFAQINSAHFEAVTEGGNGFDEAYVTGQGGEHLMEGWHGTFGRVGASARKGDGYAGVFGSWVAESGNVGNGHGEAWSEVSDRIDVSAGSTGLADGDPVQLLLQIRLDGSVKIEGSPGGTSQASFEVRSSPGTVLHLDWWTGWLNPPQEFEVHDSWEFVLDTTVGAHKNYNVFLRSWLLSTPDDEGTSGTDWMDLSYVARVIPAPGFEGLELVSEAGAPSTPIPTADDFDGDGVADALDNCIGTYNPAQRDTDLDGIGNYCDPDLNQDCGVNFGDLAAFKALFLTADPNADFDGDGSVNFGDLAIMKKHFLVGPGPAGLVNLCTPTVLTSGAFTVHPGMALELDGGSETTVDDFNADLAWTVVAAPGDVVFETLHGAKVAAFGFAGVPDAADCMLAELDDDPVPLAALAVGDNLCVRTNTGLLARFGITAANSALLPTATEMSVDFTVWQ